MSSKIEQILALGAAGQGAEEDHDGDQLWLMVFLNLLLVLLAVFIMILAVQQTRRAQAQTEDPDRLKRLEQARDSEALKQQLTRLKLGVVDMHKGRPRIVLSSGVVFASASARLTGDAQRRLGELARTLEPLDSRLMIEGHTDDRPIRTAQYPSNWELSVARALAVLRLFRRNGISPARMKFVGYGQHRPRAANETAQGRRMNRRIEIKVR